MLSHGEAWAAKRLRFGGKEPIIKVNSRGRLRSDVFFRKGATALMDLFSHKERAQGLVEYVLILIIVGVTIFVLLTLLGPAIMKFVQDLIAPV